MDVATLVKLATCGVIWILACFQNGCSLGSGSFKKTSKNAPDSFESSRELIKSSSTKCSPRPTLIRKESLGNFWKVFLFKIPLVWSVNGNRLIKKLELFKNESNSFSPW